MVERLLQDFPMCRGMFEYEDYQSSPTRAAASEFITRAMEDNYDQIAKRENYVGYIAQRPRAERIGTHGLFNGTGCTLPLSKIAEEIAHHPGNVWLPILSLRREDAARLGYDNAKQWQALLTAYAPEIAEAMKIPWDQFRWYAAFHNEGSHPHVHMVCYSADGHSGFLDQGGIGKIKSGLARSIFRQELTEIYQQQTQRRNELVQKSGEAMRELVRQILSGTLESPRIEQLMDELAQRLKNTSGKKQYGYLNAPLKAIVNEIIDELAKDTRVAAAYDLWYRLREEVLRTYRDDLPQRLPLSQQKEFKRIKNLVIEEAIRLGRCTELFDPADAQEPDEPDLVPEEIGKEVKYALGKPRQGSDTLHAVIRFSQAAEQGNPHAMAALGKIHLEMGNHSAALRRFQQAAQLGSPYAQYQAGKLLLSGDDTRRDVEAALRWLTASAEQGNQHAQYTLGKLYLLGRAVPQDKEAALRWLTLSANQGNAHARYFLDHMDNTPALFTSAVRLLHHMGRIFQEQAPPSSGGISLVDSKLRRKIREKKIAMGHKPDDHEEQTQKLL
jgi:hypothetical protein